MGMGIGQKFLQFVELRLILDRPDLRALLFAIIHHSLIGQLGERRAKIVIKRGGRVNPLGGKADLPGIERRRLKIAGATTAISASSSTIAASLPPSSSVIRLSVSATLCITFLPVPVEPVNDTLATSGWVVSRAPRSFWSTITFSTPAGRMFAANSPSSKVVSGVVGAGLATIVLPRSARAQASSSARAWEVPRRNRRHHAQRCPLADQAGAARRAKFRC
jgi:hypothetical protein